MEVKEFLPKLARWSGFVASFFVVIVGLVHIFSIHARISWPNSFLSDVNKMSWRMDLFTFQPDTFADVWSPLVLGLCGLLSHFKAFSPSPILGSFPKLAVFNFVMGLFGCIGYEGGLGILFSIPVWIAVLFCIISAIVTPGDASLELAVNIPGL